MDWKNKNILLIGDSLTAAGVYPKYLEQMLDCNVKIHAKGGVGIVQCVDGDNGLGGNYDNRTAADGVLEPLKTDEVADADIIIMFCGYNNRDVKDGSVGDEYSLGGDSDDTIAGYMQYAINRVRFELKKANNEACRILIVTVDCSGYYPWVDADGYEEYPKGSGESMETLADIQVAVAKHNNLEYIDLYHHGAFCRETWSIYGAEPEPFDTSYTMYELDENGNRASDEHLRYEYGKSYYQIRDGKPVLEKYLKDELFPYPYYRDQLHKSDAGYKKIAEIIAEKLNNEM